MGPLGCKSSYGRQGRKMLKYTILGGALLWQKIYLFRIQKWGCIENVPKSINFAMFT